MPTTAPVLSRAHRRLLSILLSDFAADHRTPGLSPAVITLRYNRDLPQAQRVQLMTIRHQLDTLPTCAARAQFPLVVIRTRNPIRYRLAAPGSLTPDPQPVIELPASHVTLMPA